MRKISTLGTHYILDQDILGFSASDYSKFKFGSSNVGAEFGKDLFNKLVHSKGSDLLSYKKIYVFTSPYDYIPTATNTIFNTFFDQLTKFMTKKCIVEKRKIHRNTTYTNDYGSLSKEERMHLISNDRFDLENDFGGDELLIFLDDIKITGSHEYVVKRTLDDKNITNDTLFLYHAILQNDTVNPTFENYLNYKYVKGVKEITELYNNSDFVLNTRFTKYLLQLNTLDFNFFIDNIDSTSIVEIINSSIGNKYDKEPSYVNNLNRLKNLIKSYAL